jgi:ATP-dependent Clp protease adaptor protein ClpS
VSTDPTSPTTAVRPDVRETPETRLFPPYNVILQNDDHHSQEFVVEVLSKVLRCPKERAFQLMIEAHTSGRSVIWSGPKEVAELKAEQVCTFHEIRNHGPNLGPLTCYVEPAPG